LLAPYVGFESVQALVNGERPDVSYLGTALAATSLVVMPAPWMRTRDLTIMSYPGVGFGPQEAGWSKLRSLSSV
jgi:hypothetical protein